jgi:hypothetical protein
LFTTKEYPTRVFDETGDSVGWEFVEVVILEGITFNGMDLSEDDFDENDRLVYL